MTAVFQATATDAALPPPLRLYSRQGCCLCEGLEERLLALLPPSALDVVDVDADPGLQARYGLRVPVLAVAVEALLPPDVTGAAPGGPGAAPGLPGPAAAAAAAAPQASGAWRDLPPVPPRLAGERLQAWLAGVGVGPALGSAGGGAVGGAAAPTGPLPPARL